MKMFDNWYWMGWYWMIESPNMKNAGWGYWPFMRVYDKDNMSLILHEESHLKTELSLLMVIHGILYLLFWFIYGYKSNPFERYASSLETRVMWRFLGWVLYMKPKLEEWDGILRASFQKFSYRGRTVVAMRKLARWQYHKIYLPIWLWTAAALWVIVRNAICDCVYLTVATAIPVIVVTVAVFLWTYHVRRGENRKRYIYAQG